MADEQVIENPVIEKAAAQIASDLFGKEPDSQETDINEPIEETTETSETTEKPPIQQQEKPLPDDKTTPVKEEAIPPPKSWAKEKHEIWGKLPKEAQEYYGQREKQMLDGLDQYKEFSGIGKQMHDVMQPYKPILTAAGINEVEGVQRLLNAHYRLTQGAPETRMQAFYKLGVNLGFYQPGVEPGKEQQIDPNVRQLYNEVNSLKQTLSAREQQNLQAVQSKVSQDVQAFASDPAHPYFDEVADDIVMMIKTGAELNDAYEKAVWANPVTRTKEQARIQTETEKTLKEKAKSDAQNARKAAGSNVRTRDTTKPPTEVKGKLFSAEHDQELLDIVRKGKTH